MKKFGENSHQDLEYTEVVKGSGKSREEDRYWKDLKDEDESDRSGLPRACGKRAEQERGAAF